MFQEKTEVLARFFSRGWVEADEVLIECGYTNDVVTSDVDAVLEQVSLENEGLISIVKLYRRKGRLGRYRYNPTLEHDREGCGYVAGLSKISNYEFDSKYRDKRVRK